MFQAMNPNTAANTCNLSRVVGSDDLPSPNQPIIRLNHLSDASETTFGQHSSRGVGFRESVGPHDANVAVIQRKFHQGGRGLCGVAFALMLGIDPISDLHHTLGIRRSFKAALAYRAPVTLAD